MTKKILLVMILCIFMGGILYAEDANAEKPLPKNTISTDVLLTGSTFLLTGIYNLSGEPSLILGTGIQYERQLSGYFGLAGHLGYTGIYGFDTGSYISSFAAEGHIRYYPWQKTFFLNAMVGYGNLIAQFDGSKIDLSHYFKVGGKLGWKIDFGEPGGLVLEPSFGYYGAIGQTNMSVGPNFEPTGDNFFANIVSSIFEALMLEYLAKFILVGGPRFSLCLGYRF